MSKVCMFQNTLMITVLPTLVIHLKNICAILWKELNLSFFTQCGKFIMIYPITLILHEINFEDDEIAKFAFLTHLEPMNFDFYDFLHILKAAVY